MPSANEWVVHQAEMECFDSETLFQHEAQSNGVSCVCGTGCQVIR